MPNSLSCKGVNYDFRLVVDADKQDIRSPYQIITETKDIEKMIRSLVSMSLDDKGIPMTEKLGTFQGIYACLVNTGFRVELDQELETIRPDLDGIPA